MPESQPRSLAHTFEPLPLSRGRAYVSLTFAGLTLLFIGGVLSYASGSPDVQGTVSTYWTVFFMFYAVVFGGAALFGAFPRLARWPFKLGWLLLVSITLVAALVIRSSAPTAALADSTLASLRPYAAALLPVLVGAWWSGEPAASA